MVAKPVVGRHNSSMLKPFRNTVLVLLAGCSLLNAQPAFAGEALPVPAAIGSLGPNIADGTSGLRVLSWIEPAGDDHALRFSRWADGRWQPAQTAVAGSNWFVNWADFPSVVPVTETFWTAHWLVRRPSGGYAYDVYVAVSVDAGKSWSEPRPAHDDDTDTEHGFVSTYTAADGAGLVWLDGRKTGKAVESGAMAGMTLRTAILTPDATLIRPQELDGLICDCCQTDVAVTDDGPVAVYRDRTADEVRDIYIARNIDGAWQPGTPVAHDGWVIPGCPVNGPVVKSAGSEVVVAWFTAANDAPRVRLARSPGPDKPFTSPIDVMSDRAVGRVGLLLLDDGSAVISALRSMGGGRAELLLTRIDKNDNASNPYVVASVLPPFSVPQLSADADDIIVVYTERDANGSRIKGARVPISEL